MLPKLYRQKILEFQAALQQLQETCQPGGAGMPKEAFQAVQQIFGSLPSSNAMELDPAAATKVQSYQTEMMKQMRLLNMDVVFLQAARQSVTNYQRRRQMNDRIDLLLRYCEAMLGEETQETGGNEEAG